VSCAQAAFVRRRQQHADRRGDPAEFWPPFWP
jgi:hypothetical protein